MNAISKLLILVTIIISPFATLTFAATKTASVSGDWDQTATWGGAAVPGSVADIIINTGVTVTMTGDYTTSNTLTINGTGTIDLAGYNLTVGSITGSGTIDIISAGGTCTVTVGSLNTSTTFSGVISSTTGTVNLTKLGTGTLTPFS